ncbi:MAG: 16S rRNA (cytidine(1402)-2'-O)-methyltransferase [Bacilli bacterium]|nr:16S rRNA (cytidine(1402)-2'-O)-methyltransferase [Bacilli bacterium]
MIIQKSTSQKQSTLYLVPTPIGNLGDMTPRAIEVLSSVDYVFAEDTRVTKIILSHFNINTKLKSYHIFNEDSSSDEILSFLKDGSNVALVSDAGMPAISDPGFLVVSKVLDAGLNVISLPGANALLTALVASGIPSERFYFYGFLKHKASQKEKELIDLVDFKDTLIFYESPHRIKETINIMYKVFGNRKIAIARELTKRYEEYIRGNLEDVSKLDLELKGEIVIVVNGAILSSNALKLNEMDIEDHYQFYIDEGYESKEAMKMVAKDRGVSKSEIYKVINIK